MSTWKSKRNQGAPAPLEMCGQLGGGDGRSVESAGKGDHAAALGKARGNCALQAKNDPGEDPDFLNYSKAFSGKKGNSDKAQSHIVFNFHRIKK